MGNKKTKRSDAIEVLLAAKSIKKLQRRILRPDKVTGVPSGSEGTFETYLQRLKRFLEWAKLGPDEFVQKVEDGTAYPPEMLNDFFDEKGGAPRSLKAYAAAVKKLMRVNLSREAKRSIDWDDIELPKMRSVETSKAPTREVIKAALAESRGIQDRVVPLVAASSGMRVASIAGLTVGEVDLETFDDVAVIRVRPDIAKGKVGYVTFLTPEAKSALIESLERRRNKGEKISNDSPLIRTRTGGFYADPDTLTYRWTQMLDRAGHGEKKRRHRIYHFHSLRSFFRTRLGAAGVDKSLRERLLGHSGEYLDASYYSPEFDELLAAYRSGVNELTVYSPEVVGEERMGALEAELAETKKAFEALKKGTIGRMMGQLAAAGVNTSKSPHELAREMGVLERLREEAEEMKREAENLTQKVIPEDTLQDYIDDGWRFVAALSNGSSRVVVEK